MSLVSLGSFFARRSGQEEVCPGEAWRCLSPPILCPITFPPGATFVQDTEVTFYPGEERLRIIQTAEGLDPENYLSMKINIQGQVPYVPANSIAHLAPYKEIYHHSDSGIGHLQDGVVSASQDSHEDVVECFGTVCDAKK